MLTEQSMLTDVARRWWVFALRGVLAILFGVLAIFWPALTLVVLVILFGAYALVDGIFAVVAAVANRTSSRWWTLVEGLAGIVAGILTFVWPSITALVLVYVIAAWAVVTGIMEIAAAVRLRREISNEWFLILGGILSVLFGVFVAIFPGAGALSIVLLIAIYSILFGILFLILGFRLRGWSRTPQSGPMTPGRVA